ncbi:SusC/RagA family TonB-linked outer membrane protein [Psychroflexus sediminis]|uniref:TonB-linked outer membrane protein, SusC/RagA family n=1 Tax=Psychroflexus sediminis TaxID=470826 RepID=A0A1G7TS23_9FLAO|nr:TonB-dependent receptor [Psychroflexus sediminis]SDG38037.1 TonB-linked outer membrane protein, SusC/RagA family [Psychroflexus sediminis]
MVKNFLIATLCLLSTWTYSQEIDIEGSVSDMDSGMPLLGVNVIIEGTTKGTTTNFDGEFLLTSVPTDATLVFSYLGYETKKVNVAETTDFTIQLQSDTQALDDVVVIGYGASSRRKLTGSVSTVDAESIQDLEPLNAANALQGTTAGVSVTPQSGSPGAESNIRIRGISTNGNSSPLIILDGFQYDGGLNSINPQDIESITVLKDAQAAIYGSVGANGVVLIETKTGKRNQAAEVTYNTYFGLQQTTRELPLLNNLEYALLTNEKYANAGQSLPFPDPTQIRTNTDWQDQVFETAAIVSNNVSVRGGSENTDYSFSASHLYQKGIVAPEKSNFKRTTANLSVNTDVRDFLNLSAKVIYTNNRSQGINSFGLGSVLFNAINIAPTIRPDRFNLDGTIDLGNEVANPLAQINNTFNDFESNRLSGSFQAELEYIKDFKLTARYGFNSSNLNNREFFPEFDFGTGKVFNRPFNQVNLNQQEFYDYTFDLFNTIEKSFFDRELDVTFTVGMTAFRTHGEGLFGARTGVPRNSYEFADLGTATGLGDNQTNGSFVSEFRRLSYFSRVQFSFKDRYLLTGILRRDTSSSFGPNNSTAWFPSVTGGWIITEEDFIGTSDVLNFAKLRASYGELGNDRIPNFLFLSVLSGEATYVLGEEQNLVNGQALGPVANPNVKWETAKKLDIGLDLKLFNNNLDVTLDYYDNTREDLLIPFIPTSGIFGTAAPGSSAPTRNAGTVKNYGFEAAIGYSKEVSKDFSFNVNYNISTINNEVTEINGAPFLEGGQFSVGQLPPARMEVGQPIGYFYGLKTDGIFQNQTEVEAHPSQRELAGVEASPGDIRFVDVNGDGIVNQDDRTYIGDPIPDVTMGLNLSFNYKNFEFSAYSFANLGSDIVRNFERDQPNVNMLSRRLDRWTGPGTSNFEPRVTAAATANKLFSDYFVEDGSFLRIQTISLGYYVPEKALESVGISSVKLYAKVDNAFTFTEYSGYDPTASTGAPIGGGIDLGFYPLPRTFSLGLNVKL